MAAAIVSVVPVLAVAVLTVVALLFTRRPRPVGWMIPAFGGAILAGTTLGTAFCTYGMLGVIQGIRVTGTGGIAAVASGVETALDVVRICHYASAVAALILVPRFFLALRRNDSTAEPGAPRTGLIVASSVLPLLFAVAGFSLVYGVSDALVWRGSQMAHASGSAQALAAQVASRAVAIAVTGVAGFGLCLVGVFAPLSFRTGGRGNAAVRRFGALFLAVTAGFVIAAIVLVERFFAMARSLAYTG